MSARRWLLPFLAGLTACDPQPGQQSLESFSLAPALATLGRGFTYLGSAVELHDGRVLLSDPPDGSLFITDSGLTSVRSFGTRGNGPMEYVNAVPLIGFGADSSLQIDYLARRWLVLHRDSVVAQLPPDDPLVVTGHPITGADIAGNVLLMVSPAVDSRTGRQLDPTDSITLVLASRRAGSRNTVASLRPPGSGPPGSANIYHDGEIAYLSQDGWIAVVRFDPYRVEWRSPGGTWITGPALPDDGPRMDADERAWLGARARLTRFVGPDWERRIAWPNRVPPVRWHTGQVHSRDSLLVLLRQPHSRAPGVRYDVINRRGELVGRIVLDDGQRILGFGQQTVYVVTTDDDGLEWLSRHRWPPW